MLSRKTLLPDQISAALKNTAWKFESNALTCEFEFKDFKEAFSFLTKIALVSEKLDHHAEIWNIYNKVKLKVSSHDTEPKGGGITQFDLEFIKLVS